MNPEKITVEFDEDPDATFADMLSHIRWSHQGEDQSPAVLWPKIEVSTP